MILRKPRNTVMPPPKVEPADLPLFLAMVVFMMVAVPLKKSPPLEKPPSFSTTTLSDMVSSKACDTTLAVTIVAANNNPSNCKLSQVSDCSSPCGLMKFSKIGVHFSVNENSPAVVADCAAEVVAAKTSVFIDSQLL